MAIFTLLFYMLLLQISTAKNVQNVPLKNSFQPQNDVLAFSAELSKDAEVAPGGTIVFDRTFTNVGGLYFNTSGQFLCPDGLYVFIWNLAKAASNEEGMRSIGSLSSRGVNRKYGPKTSYYTTTNSGVAEMTHIHECSSNRPTAVTITSQPWTTGANPNTLFHREMTSFSGFKLHAGIAFTAELSTDQLAFPGGRIMFDDVLANFGGFYDAINGRFRCPDDGVYVFSVFTHTRDPNSQWSVSRLMMEGEVVMQGPISYIAYDGYDSGTVSTSAVLQCTADFSVYVEAQASHDFRDNSYGAELTSFTGFKLYHNTTDPVAFSVVMTKNFTASTNEDYVVFDKVITNIGSAFETNNSESSFVCPDDSYYMLTWTAVTSPSSIETKLYRDGWSIKWFATTPQSSTQHTSGSCTQSVIVQCEPDSRFQVVHGFNGRTLLGGYTAFSGYKLPG